MITGVPKTLKLTDIEVGDRRRSTYTDLETLGLSIRENGLLHPIVLGLNPAKNPPYLLAAGGRRLAAHKLLSNSNPEYLVIQCNVFEKILTELELRSIELEENIRREKLPYDDEVRLKNEVQNLRFKIHGQKITRDGSDEGWTQEKTGELFGLSPSAIAEDIELAKAFEMFPDAGLDKLKNKTEAKKVLKQLKKAFINQDKANTFQQSLTKGRPIKERLIKSFMLRDFFEGVKSVMDETIDLVEIDPPYAIDLTEIKKGYVNDGYEEIEQDKYLIFMENVLKESVRVMKEGSFLLLWFAPEPWFDPLFQLLSNLKLKVHRMVNVWTKSQGQTNQPLRRLASSYEMFYYASKGDGILKKPGRSNVFSYSGVPPAQKIHPTERPLELMEDVLTTFAEPNANVMVPFLGSGNTLLAAFNSKMNAFGWEINSSYKDNFIVRVNENIKEVE